MPFDGIGSESNPSLVIVNHMMRTLINQNHWTKNRMQEWRPGGGSAYCLLGALKLALLETTPRSQRRKAGKQFCHVMNDVINRMTWDHQFRFVKCLVRIGLSSDILIMQFNDDLTTDHCTMMRILYETRTQLCATTVTV
jgi:hypothetical protein